MRNLKDAIIEEIKDSNTECCALTSSILHDVISFEIECSLQEIKDELRKLTDEGILKVINRVDGENRFAGRAYVMNLGGNSLRNEFEVKL